MGQCRGAPAWQGRQANKEIPAGCVSLAKEPVYAPGDPDSRSPLRPCRGLSAAPRGLAGSPGTGLIPTEIWLAVSRPLILPLPPLWSLPHPSPGQ